MKTLVLVFSFLALFGREQIQGARSIGERILFQADFEDHRESDFARKLLENRNVSLSEKAGPDGSNAIRVAYVGYERGSERVVLRYPLAKKVREATLSFDARFDTDFQWVRGGKMHGLGPEQPITGGNARRPDGWSARITFKPDGHCASYLYDQGKDRKYGVGKTSEDPVFTAGKWHKVSIHVALNDPGKSNGLARITVDGNEVIESRDVAFRGVGGQETLIQQFIFSTFHGGHEPKWAPVDSSGAFTTVYAYYDNFVVAETIRQSGDPAD